jgi:gas vesicle protein
MKSFFLGLTVGAGLGLLLAPAQGSETRRQIAEKASELKKMPRRKLEEEVRSVRHEAGEIGRKAAEEAFDETTRRVAGEKWP